MSKDEMEVTEEKVGEPIEESFAQDQEDQEEGIVENNEGQFEIDGIDTPLGAAAQEFLACIESQNRAVDNTQMAKAEVLEQMDQIGKTSFVYQGKKFTRVEGSVKNPTLRISN